MITKKFTVVYKDGKKCSFFVASPSYNVIVEIQISFLHKPDVKIAFFD